MNLLLLRPEELAADGTTLLAGRRARHVLDVLRAEVGDRIAAGVLGGRIGHALVTAAGPLEVALEVSLSQEPPDPPGIDLLLALPRPKVLRRALRHVASLGVKRIVLVSAARVEKSYFDSPLLDPSRVEEALLLGLEQARDTRLPEVILRRRFRPFVEDESARLWPEPAGKLVGHPAAERLLDAPAAGDPATPVALAVGPEGGFVPFEIELLVKAGFLPVTLGPRTLAVETALVALVSTLAHLRRLGPCERLSTVPDRVPTD